MDRKTLNAIMKKIAKNNGGAEPKKFYSRTICEVGFETLNSPNVIAFHKDSPGI